MLQDEVEKSLSFVIRDKYRKSTDVLDSSGQFVAKVDEYLPLRFQFLSEPLDDALQTREKVLCPQPVDVFHITGTRETILTSRSPSLIGLGYSYSRRRVSAGSLTTGSGSHMESFGYPRRLSSSWLPTSFVFVGLNWRMVATRWLRRERFSEAH